MATARLPEASFGVHRNRRCPATTDEVENGVSSHGPYASPDGRVSQNGSTASNDRHRIVPREVRTLTVSRPSLRIRRRYRWRTRALAAFANRGGAHRALQHGGEEGSAEVIRDPAAALRTLRFLSTWALEHAPQTPAPAGGQCAGGRECCQDRSRGSGCTMVLSISTHHHGSPSRNVQYHPPRLSEVRLTSPSLTAIFAYTLHCSGEIGNRPPEPRDEADSARRRDPTRAQTPGRAG